MFRRFIALVGLGVICCCSQTGFAQSKQKSLDDAKVFTYKTTEDAQGKPVHLKVYVYQPAAHETTDQRAAVVFFFGGGWRAGDPGQFAEHCRYLAKRGMVAMTADYRVLSRQGTKAIACVEDGKSAIRWVRENAKRLGVDPGRVAAGGGSAGGHVAAATGTIKTLDRSTETKSISSVPDALILFNPALVLAPVADARHKLSQERIDSLPDRMGTDPISLSPYHHVDSKTPPTILFHGKADKTVPYWTAELFAEAMEKAGSRCELKGYPDQGHGFFNVERKNGKYDQTIDEMDDFLVSLGFLAEQK